MRFAALVALLVLLSSCTPGPEGHARVVRFSSPAPVAQPRPEQGEAVPSPVSQQQPGPADKPTPPPATAQVQPPLPPVTKPELRPAPGIQPPLPTRSEGEEGGEETPKKERSDGWFSQKQPQPAAAPGPPAASPEPKKAVKKAEPARLPAEHSAFTNMASYPRTMAVWKDNALLRAKGPRRIVISIARQRGTLMVNGKVAMDFPVCTGRKSKPTPRGTFRIIEKNVHHRSNLYHCDMPYFMRLTWDGIGLHVGPVRRTPSSHGCIRLTRGACVLLFRHSPRGTSVEIH